MAVINIEVQRKYNELSQFETLQSFNEYYRNLTKVIAKERLLTKKHQAILKALFHASVKGKGVCHMKYATLCKKADVKSTSTIHSFLKVAKEFGFLKNVAEVETVDNTRPADRRGGKAFTYFVFQADTNLVSSVKNENQIENQIENGIENREGSTNLTVPTVESTSSDTNQVFKQGFNQDLNTYKNHTSSIHTSYEESNETMNVENDVNNVVVDFEFSKDGGEEVANELVAPTQTVVETTKVVEEVIAETPKAVAESVVETAEVIAETPEEVVTLSKEETLEAFGVPSEFYQAVFPLGLSTQDIVSLYTKSIAKGVEQELAPHYPEQAKVFHVEQYLDVVKTAAVRTRFVINSNKGTRKEIRNVVGYFLRTLMNSLGEKFVADHIYSTLISCQVELEAEYIDDSNVLDFAVLTLMQDTFRGKMDYEGVLDMVLNVLDKRENSPDFAA